MSLRPLVPCALLSLLPLVALASCAGAPRLPARPTTLLPNTPSSPHSESVFTASDGLSLYEQSWRPVSGRARAALVVVHGLKDHGARYSELAARLTEKGYSVHAADLRGHGRSQGERVWVEHFSDYVGDLATYVDLVKKRESPSHIFVLGHSMGGAIVSLFYLQKKPDVAGIILSAAALKAAVSGFKIFGTNIVAGIAPRAAVFQLDLADFSRDPKVVADASKDPLVYQPAAAARTAQELLGAMKPIETNYESFVCPILILHGTKDVVTDPEGSRALAARAKGPRTLKIYEGLYHDLLHEPERATVMSDIEEFLEKHTPNAVPPSDDASPTN